VQAKKKRKGIDNANSTHKQNDGQVAGAALNQYKHTDKPVLYQAK
jgi:hypothetical protein